MKAYFVLTIYLLFFNNTFSSSQRWILEDDPFVIIRDSVYAAFPKNIKDYKSGAIFVTLAIDENGNKLYFVIEKVVFADSLENNIINYINKSSEQKPKKYYPLNVRRFYKTIREYVNNLEIKKVDGTEPNGITHIIFVIRFR
jgi:hypothetical protein